MLVRRQREKLRRGRTEEVSEEYAYYASSVTLQEATAEEMLGHIRNHWAACENGSHYRRDATLGEDDSQVRQRTAAHVVASLRNLVIGLFELQKEKGTTNARYLPSWQRKMKASEAIKMICRGP